MYRLIRTLHMATVPGNDCPPTSGGAHLDLILREAYGQQYLSKGLVTNYRKEGGGATKREGEGHVKFHPYEKEGAQKVLAMLKGGGGGGGDTTSFGVVF